MRRGYSPPQNPSSPSLRPSELHIPLGDSKPVVQGHSPQTALASDFFFDSSCTGQLILSKGPFPHPSAFQFCRHPSAPAGVGLMEPDRLKEDAVPCPSQFNKQRCGRQKGKFSSGLDEVNKSLIGCPLPGMLCRVAFIEHLLCSSPD